MEKKFKKLRLKSEEILLKACRYFCTTLKTILVKILGNSIKNLRKFLWRFYEIFVKVEVISVSFWKVWPKSEGILTKIWGNFCKNIRTFLGEKIRKLLLRFDEILQTDYKNFRVTLKTILVKILGELYLKLGKI